MSPEELNKWSAFLWERCFGATDASPNNLETKPNSDFALV